VIVYVRTGERRSKRERFLRSRFERRSTLQFITCACCASNSSFKYAPGAWRAPLLWKTKSRASLLGTAIGHVRESADSQLTERVDFALAHEGR
jgi:hypothetical protein